MATQVQNRRGSTAEHSTFTGAFGELTVDTDKDTVVVHDGSTAGGAPLLREDQSNLPTSAPSNGVYLPSANNVAISSNGVQRINIGADGDINIDSGGVFYDATNNRLAIGDNAPGSTLTVKGATGVTPLQISGPSSEFMRCDSSGRVLVGRSTSTQTDGIVTGLLQIASSGNTRGISALQTSSDSAATFIQLSKVRGTSIVQSGDFLGRIAFNGYDGSAYKGGVFIDAAVDGTPGADDMPSRLVLSTTSDGSSSPTERIIIKENGATYLNVNATNTGVIVANKSYGYLWGASDTKAMLLNSYSDVVAEYDRRVSDGALVNFYQSGTLEGNISVSGTTVSYNGAHLSRWSQLVGIDPYDKTARPEILRGTVMSNLDEMCDWTCPVSGDCQDNEQLNKTEISSVDDDPNVAGVFQSWDDDDDTWVNDYYLAMTGDFVIRIAAGTTVQRGDLLCSAGDGTARPQGDRYIKDSTIAKVTSTTVSCTHPDGSYCVPCVLMAC